MRFANKRQTVSGLEAEEGVKLLIDDPEDLWHAHNLINEGDLVDAPTLRTSRVEAPSTHNVVYKTEYLNLTVKVKSVFYDPAVSELKVSGFIARDAEGTVLGQHHTLTIKWENRKDRQLYFTLWKEDGWDTVAREALSEALNPDRPESMIAIVMQEGLSNICLVTGHRTILRQRVNTGRARKADELMNKKVRNKVQSFYEQTLLALRASADLSMPRTLILASPGFVAHSFREYLAQAAIKQEDKVLQKMANEAIIVHTSTGQVHNLNEVLMSPEVEKTVRNCKFAAASSIMDRFYEMMRKEDGRAWYGFNTVSKAVSEGAVGRGGGILLMNIALFRAVDLPTRKKYVALVDKVKADGGEVRLLSNEHESGQRLDALGGVAAILTYPMFELDLEENEEEKTKAHDGKPNTEEWEESAEGTTII